MIKLLLQASFSNLQSQRRQRFSLVQKYRSVVRNAKKPLKQLKRLLNIGLIISFFGCYVDWGHDGAEFIFQTQLHFFSMLTGQASISIFAILASVLIGELSLAFGAISKNNIAYRRLTIFGLTFLTVIVLLVVVMSLMTSNWMSLLSTTPYTLFTILTIRSLQIGK